MDAVRLLLPQARCDCVGTMRQRFRILRNGTEQWGAQCIRCGSWTAAKKSTFSARPDEEYDESIGSAWHEHLIAFWREQSEAREQEAEHKRAAERRAWLASHDAYLQTDKWRSLRARVLRRDNGICQGCLVQNATQVHHLSYAHWRDELLFELTSLCDACHTKAHQDRLK
jgi:hypothetical protein